MPDLETVLKLLRDPRIAALTICLLVLATGFLYTGLLFEWGPTVIRPASAQSVREQVNSAKGEVLSQIGSVQSQLTTITNTQGDMQKQHDLEAREHLEQQLLWWRQQNCKSKGDARNYAWRKMRELSDRFSLLTKTDWPMPTCSDIGD